MKKITLLFTLIFMISFNAFSQERTLSVEAKDPKNRIYKDVDVLASYRGGYEKVYEYVNQETKSCMRNVSKRKIQKVIVDVLITDNGNVGDVLIVDESTPNCHDEIIKAIKNCKQWIPARVNNKPVNSYLRLIINSEFSKTHSNMISKNTLY